MFLDKPIHFVIAAGILGSALVAAAAEDFPAPAAPPPPTSPPAAPIETVSVPPASDVLAPSLGADLQPGFPADPLAHVDPLDPAAFEPVEESFEDGAGMIRRQALTEANEALRHGEPGLLQAGFGAGALGRSDHRYDSLLRELSDFVQGRASDTPGGIAGEAWRQLPLQPPAALPALDSGQDEPIDDESWLLVEPPASAPPR